MIGNTFYFDFEVKLIEWCQTNLPASFIQLAKYATYLGDVVFMVGIVAFFYLCYDKKAGRRIVFNAVFSLLVSCEVKNIFKRRRPYFDNESIKCLKVVDENYDAYDITKQGFSFPSMHSSNISTVTGSIFEYYRKKVLLIIAIVVSLLVGISRFVLGCHYPTDVLFGLLSGLITVIFFSKLQDNLSDSKLYLVMIVFGLVGFIFCESTDFYSAYGIAVGFIFCDFFDKKYTKFNNTRNIAKIILRLLFACGVFLAVSEGLKLPFNEEILDANTVFAHAYRAFRYAIASFIGMGLTPILYKYNILKLDDKMKGDK